MDRYVTITDVAEGEMNHGRLFSAGVIGGAAVSVLAAVLRAAAVPVEPELWLGSVVLPPGRAAWLVGFFWHLTLSGFVATVYGRVFVALGRGGARMALRVSLLHILGSGLALGLLPLLHPRIPGAVAAPGFFLTGHGVAGAAALVALHLVFAAVVGALAEPPAPRVPVRRGTRVFHTLPPRRAGPHPV